MYGRPVLDAPGTASGVNRPARTHAPLPAAAHSWDRFLRSERWHDPPHRRSSTERSKRGVFPPTLPVPVLRG
jgi:hypothetical protein